MASIGIKQLAEYAVDQIESGVSAVDVSRKLASFLLQERRSRDSGAMLRAIEAEFSKRGSVQVTVTSAHEVSKEIEGQLASLLDVANPVFDRVIDPSVIGGVKASAGEKEIDLTVKSRLNRFKQQVISK